MSTLTDTFQAIANAIRAKTGKSDTMTPAEMPGEIADIGGGGELTRVIDGHTNRINISVQVYEEE